MARSFRKESESKFVELLARYLRMDDIPPCTEDESPDFILMHKGKRIGIEVIELNVPAKGLPNRQVESFEDFIVSAATKLAVERGLPPVSAYLFFNIHRSLSRLVQREIACAVVDTVEECLPAIGGRIELEFPYASGKQPKEVDLIHIARHDGAMQHWWRPVRASWVMKNCEPVFQDAISTKSGKYLRYREKCDECWLVLGAEGTKQSSAIRPSDEALNTTYVSTFDRTFFVRLADAQCHELLTSTKAV